jgi:AbiV family abortive infection protein
MQQKSTQFYNISPEECAIVYLKVIENGERHFSIGELLARKEEFGNGISHLILGSEELIKGLILFLDSKHFGIRNVPEVREVFFMHAPRHNLIKEFYSVWLGIKPLIQKRPGRRRNAGIGERILRKTMSIAEGALKGYLHFEWWKKADQLKQRGFYADYKDVLITPEDIKSDEYERAYRYTSALREDIQFLIGYIQCLGEKKLTELREDIETADFKTLIKESIKRK